MLSIFVNKCNQFNFKADKTDELDFKLEIWAIWSAAMQGYFIAVDQDNLFKVSTFWNKRNGLERQSVLQFENNNYAIHTHWNECIKHAISRRYLAHTSLSKLKFKVRSEGNWTMIDASYKATFRTLNFS